MTLALAVWTAVVTGGTAPHLTWNREADSPLGGVKWAHLDEGSEVTVTQTSAASRSVVRRVLATAARHQVSFDVSTDDGAAVRQADKGAPTHFTLSDVLRLEELEVGGRSFATEVRELRESPQGAKAAPLPLTVWALRRAGRLMVVKSKRGDALQRTPVQLDAKLTVDGREFRCQHWREQKGATTLESWECPGLPVPARELERTGAAETERVVTAVMLQRSGTSGEDGP